MDFPHEQGVLTSGSNHTLEASGAKNPYSQELVSYFMRSYSSQGLWTLAIAVTALVLVLNYLQAWHKYHQRERFGSDNGPLRAAELPPLYPSLVPFLSSAISFAWDNAGFIRRATTYEGKSTACRVAILPGLHIYLFQDRETIKQIFKHPDVASPIPVYTFAISRFFGMPERTVQVYKADNSGSGVKPHPESNVAPNSRPFHATHKGLVPGLTGPGLGPNTRRYIEGFDRDVRSYSNGQLSDPPVQDSEWVQLPDLFHFTQHTAGRAMISAHFGPTLLRLHPEYMDDLWAVDAGIPWFARCIPRFFVPGPYRARDRMIQSLMDWYAYAREHFEESAIDEDGDGDPVWGSSLSRHRQKTLREVSEHDDRAIASLDVGHSWGSTGNVVSAIFMATYHIFSSPTLLARVRASLHKTLGTTRVHSTSSPDQRDTISDQLGPKVLYSDALLCSIYSETLRLHGMTHFLVSAPAGTDVSLGNRWLLPRGSVGVLSSGISHTDDKFWNTRGGRHPVTEFWPDRFLVYPNDPQSGPVNPEYQTMPYSPPEGTAPGTGESDSDEPFFSMDGTEGSWFPYGGGRGICLGRFLAKNSILATLAYLVLEFDIEPQVDSMVVNPWRYGLGVNQPKFATPFRIRRRPLGKE